VRQDSERVGGIHAGACQDGTRRRRAARVAVGRQLVEVVLDEACRDVVRHDGRVPEQAAQERDVRRHTGDDQLVQRARGLGERGRGAGGRDVRHELGE
jgi:hypothetical protein